MHFLKFGNMPFIYELTYIIEDCQLKKLSELTERFRKRNGWSEKEILQFAVTATNQVDLDMKFRFLEGILTDLEKGEQAASKLLFSECNPALKVYKVKKKKPPGCVKTVFDKY